MKIISKHREYYDCMVGRYGRDPHLVYDRRGAEKVLIPDGDREEKITFAICNRKITITYFNGYFYMPDQKDLLNKATKKKRNTLWDLPTLPDDVPTETNKIKRKPILMKHWGDWIEPMLLHRFGLHRYIPAEQMYQNIVAFLGWLKDNPEPPEILDDKQKVKSHGFDLKKSFRHRKP